LFKSLIIKEICFGIFVDFLALRGPSFSDAELPENFTEDLVGGDFAGDGAEVVEGFAEVLGEEVGGEGCEALLDAGEGSGGVLQGFYVADVGNECGFRAGAECAI
jgi:hypothetical protein